MRIGQADLHGGRKASQALWVTATGRETGLGRYDQTEDLGHGGPGEGPRISFQDTGARKGLQGYLAKEGLGAMTR